MHYENTLLALLQESLFDKTEALSLENETCVTGVLHVLDSGEVAEMHG